MQNKSTDLPGAHKLEETLLDTKDTARVICRYLWYSKLMMVSSTVCTKDRQFVECAVYQHYITHPIVLRTLSLRSRALQRCGSLLTTRCSAGFKLLPQAAVSPPQAPPEAANFSGRASSAVSERKSMIQSSTRRRKNTPFFSALKKIRVHIVFCYSILRITT